MIIDKLKNAKNYYGLSENIKKGLKFLQNTDLKKLQIGKHEIDKTRVYASVQEYETQNSNIKKWEAHKKYIDIQLVISGEEKMGVSSIENCTPYKKYDEVNDIEFFTGSGKFFDVHPDEFVIFFPTDVHMPACSINDSTIVKKIVVKCLG